MVVFALLLERGGFAVGRSDVQRRENMQTVGGDGFGMRKVVAVGQLGFQAAFGRQLGGGVHPNFVGVGKGGGANQGKGEQFFHVSFHKRWENNAGRRPCGRYGITLAGRFQWQFGLLL